MKEFKYTLTQAQLCKVKEAAEAIIKQNSRSSNGIQCRYKTVMSNGDVRHCAVGKLFPKDSYTRECEEGTMRAIMEYHATEGRLSDTYGVKYVIGQLSAAGFESNTYDFLRQFQACHDQATPDEKYFAKDFEAKFNELLLGVKVVG